VLNAIQQAHRRGVDSIASKRALYSTVHGAERGRLGCDGKGVFVIGGDV
jgi:hypothetical protein